MPQLKNEDHPASSFFYLSHMGVNAAVATAGVVLARAILVLLTILTGYYFYHKAIAKYGKPADSR